MNTRACGAITAVLGWRTPLAVAFAVLLVAASARDGATQTAPAASGRDVPSSELRVAIDRDLLSVDLGRVHLRDVLQAIGERAGIRVTISGDPGFVRPQSFTGLPLDEGIMRLVGDNGLVTIFQSSASEGGIRRVAEAWVYGSSEVAATRTGPVRATGEAIPLLQDFAQLGREQRLQFVRRLARRKDAAAAGLLGEILAQDSDPTVRGIAATALGKVGGDKAAAALERALDDEAPSVRVRSVQGLRAMQGDDAAPLLAGVARHDEDPEVRLMTVHLLGALNSLDARAAIEAALSDPDATVREAAAAALSRGKQGHVLAE